ncbi:MAG: transposase family protein, partial [Deltaproteobacteria bacterium]|nr:transposase family protein [Deltaproteobacteria bacterium]
MPPPSLPADEPRPRSSAYSNTQSCRAFRLLDNSKIYLHAVIDNFSRKILAWDLQERVMGRTTTAVHERAARFLGDGVVSLMTDSG